MKFTEYQDKVLKSSSRQVVLRWARRTGKNELINHIAEPNDLVIHFSYRAARDAGAITMNGKNKDGVFHVDEGVLRRISSVSPKRVFLNEPALFRDLAAVMSYINNVVQPEFVYLIGTPNLSNNILSSGFLFDAICARLEMNNIDGVYYSVAKYGESPVFVAQVMKDIEHNKPPYAYKEEMLSEFKGR